jgi:hypothetical protein
MKKDSLHIPNELLDDIRRGECVPVIGAGFSINAVLPNGFRMPLWNDLCNKVAARLKEKSSGYPIKDLTNYSAKRGTFELIRLLRECLHVRVARPGAAHMEFAQLPFEQVITTNFDFLLEYAYHEVGKSCLPVVDEDLLPFKQSNGETRLIKMHGDLNHPSLLVMTEDDYDGFCANRERMFQEITHLLSANTVLFIGYSIDDPDFRQIWNLVKKHFGKFRRPAYALLVDAPESKIDEYSQRGVTKVVSLPKNKKGYGEALALEFRSIYNVLDADSRKSTGKVTRKAKS